MSYGRITTPRYYGGSLERSHGGYGGYGFYGEPMLYQGSTGGDVVTLQNLLIKAGYSTMLAPYGADGDYGPKTKSAVAAYQSSKGLSATGIADQATWDSLKGTTGSGGGGGKKSAWDVIGDIAGGLASGLTGGAANAGTSDSMVTGAGTPPSSGATTTAKKFPWTWVLVGLGSVVVIGGTIYFVRKKK